MAILDEANLAAEALRRATYRVNHVGTKLNESELRAFEALAVKRNQTQGELIRGKPGTDGKFPWLRKKEDARQRQSMIGKVSSSLIHNDRLGAGELPVCPRFLVCPRFQSTTILQMQEHNPSDLANQNQQIPQVAPQ